VTAGENHEVDVTKNRTLALSLTILASLPAAGLMGCTASTPAGTMTVQQPPPPPPQQQQPVMQQQVVTAPAMMQPTASVGSGSQGSMVSQTWTATGYNVSDFVSNHMTLRARQFANGFIAVTDLVRGMMRHGERRTVVAAVVGGHCYRIIGVGGAGVQDLDLYLRDLTGNVIDQDRAPDNFPVIGLDRQLCLPAGMGNQSAQLEIRMARGEGEIGVQVFGSP
jgi:hypothetical protein